MRPQPIVNFERAYLLSIALGAVSVFSYWGELRRVAPTGPLAVISILLLGAMAGLVLLVSRRRSAAARWVIAILTGIAIAFALPSLPDSLAAGPRGWLGIAQLALQIAALAFLFAPTSRAWLNERADHAL